LYREKTQAGLSITGGDGQLLYATQHPGRVYEDFDAVPRIVIDSLLFVENRELLDPNHPRRNPAVEWDRLAHSALALGLDRIDRSGVVPGGSTLATQIEKYRHSPGGVTSSPREKLRQMLTASLRAYRNGDDTTETRKQIVVDYINSVSLAAVPSLGEVTGIPEGLSVWYGADFRTLSAILQWPRPGSIDIGPQARAKAYKEVLSLLLAARRPSDYLVRSPGVLEQRTNTYLDVLAANGVIPQELRDYGRDIDLDLRPHIAAASTKEAIAREGRRPDPLAPGRTARREQLLRARSARPVGGEHAFRRHAALDHPGVAGRARSRSTRPRWACAAFICSKTTTILRASSSASRSTSPWATATSCACRPTTTTRRSTSTTSYGSISDPRRSYARS
jgi:membrane peptidoglycan carboxypeptidase